MITSVSTSELQPITGLVGPKDLTVEEWREYDSGNRIYRINQPVALYYREGGTTHRIVDSQGVVHCVVFDKDVVLRWRNKTGAHAVGF